MFEQTYKNKHSQTKDNPELIQNLLTISIVLVELCNYNFPFVRAFVRVRVYKISTLACIMYERNLRGNLFIDISCCFHQNFNLFAHGFNII